MKDSHEEQREKKRKYMKVYDRKVRDGLIHVQSHTVTLSIYGVINIMVNSKDDIATAIGNEIVSLFNYQYNEKRTFKNLQYRSISISIHDVINLGLGNNNLITAIGYRIVDLFNYHYNKSKIPKQIRPKLKIMDTTEKDLRLLKEKILANEKKLVKNRLSTRQTKPTQIKFDWNKDSKELNFDSVEDEVFGDDLDNLSDQELSYQLEHILEY